MNFWRRVYTEITTNEGFVHDDTRLDIVYETVRLSNVERSRARASASEAGRRYVRALRAIAARQTRQPDPVGAAGHGVVGPEHQQARRCPTRAERVRFQLGQADNFREGLIRSGAWEDYVKKTMTRGRAAARDRLVAARRVVVQPGRAFEGRRRRHVAVHGSTGRRFMRIDNVVDERLDPYNSTRAAALLMQQNYEVTRAWPLAITAYNHGASGMRRAIEQVGTDDIARDRAQVQEPQLRFCVAQLLCGAAGRGRRRSPTPSATSARSIVTRRTTAACWCCPTTSPSAPWRNRWASTRTRSRRST